MHSHHLHVVYALYMGLGWVMAGDLATIFSSQSLILQISVLLLTIRTLLLGFAIKQKAYHRIIE